MAIERRPVRIVSAALIGISGVIVGGRTVGGAEPSAVPLPGETYAAVSADIDDDPDLELVRVVTGASGPGSRAVEAWDEAAGGWQPLGTRAIDDFDAEEDSVALLAWHDGTRVGALLVTAGDAADYGGGCCLAIARVVVGPNGIELRSMHAPRGRVEWLTVLDTDADGVDELLVTEPPGGDELRWLRLLRWDGDRFDGGRLSIGSDQYSFGPALVGETDGVPGEEVILGHGGAPGLLRARATADTQLRLEFAGLPAPPQDFIRAWDAADGLILIQAGDELRLISWPRDEEPTTVASTRQGGAPGFSGFDLVRLGNEHLVIDPGILAVSTRNPPVARVYDASLEEIATVPPTEPIERLWQLTQQLPALRDIPLLPYAGPVPGPMPEGMSGYLAGGHLITLDSLGGVRLRPVSSLSGLVPLGVAGADASWWIVGTFQPFGAPRGAAMFADGPATALSLIPDASVLVPELDGGRLPVRVDGAALLEGPRLLAADAGFDAVVEGPPGSVVIGALDQSIAYRGVLSESPMAVAMKPVARVSGNQSLQAAVVLRDPSGHAYSAFWEGEVLREGPSLEVRAHTATFESAARVEGRTQGATELTVDGAPVELDATGRFSAQVGASLWPRDVAVVASDPVGNETTTRLQVVGFLDYRGLPWVPIVGLGTVVAAAVLFVRVPRRRARAPILAAGDGRLEEVDGD